MMQREDIWSMLKKGNKRKDIIEAGASKRLTDELIKRFNFYKQFIEPYEILLINISYRQWTQMHGKPVKSKKFNPEFLRQRGLKGSNDIDDEA